LLHLTFLAASKRRSSIHNSQPSSSGHSHICLLTARLLMCCYSDHSSCGPWLIVFR
jgi:hypothetical protein